MLSHTLPEFKLVAKTLLWNLPFILIFIFSTFLASIKAKKIAEEQDRVSIVVEKNAYAVTTILPKGKGCSVNSFLSSPPCSKESFRICWIITDLGLSKWCRV
jgi:hypothetical protein